LACTPVAGTKAFKKLGHQFEEVLKNLKGISVFLAAGNKPEDLEPEEVRYTTWPSEVFKFPQNIFVVGSYSLDGNISPFSRSGDEEHDIVRSFGEQILSWKAKELVSDYDEFFKLFEERFPQALVLDGTSQATALAAALFVQGKLLSRDIFERDHIERYLQIHD